MADISKMDPNQLSRMMKMQYEMFKKNPTEFKKISPQYANMSDTMIESTLGWVLLFLSFAANSEIHQIYGKHDPGAIASDDGHDGACDGGE